MKECSEKELREKYEKLPRILKSALSDPEISKKISDIGRDFQVRDEESEGLTKICGLVFIGILPLEDLHKEIKERLALSEEISKSLVDNLESKVFSPYKEELAKISKIEEAKIGKPEDLRLKELLQEFKATGGEESKPRETEEISKKISEKEKSKGPEVKEKIEIKEELLKKKGPDEYREQIERVEETERARVVKEEGRIKKIF